MRRATSRSRIVLCSPRTTSVGRRDAREEGPAVDRHPRLLAQRIEAVAPPARRQPHQAVPGDGPQERGRGRRLRRAEPEAGHRGRQGRELGLQARRAALERPEALVVDVGARVDHDQPREPVRVPRGERHGVVAPHGVSGDDDVLEAERLDHARQLGSEVLAPVGGRPRPRAPPVPPPVEGQDANVPGEVGRHRVPPVGVSGGAVKGQQRPAVTTPVAVPEPQAVDGDEAVAGARRDGHGSDYGRSRPCVPAPPVARRCRRPPGRRAAPDQRRMECSTYHSNRSSPFWSRKRTKSSRSRASSTATCLEVMVPVQEPEIERLDESRGRP